MRAPGIADDGKQEKLTSGNPDLSVSQLINQSPAFKEEEDQEDENRHRWLLFEAQRVGMAEGIHQPDADKKK